MEMFNEDKRWWLQQLFKTKFALLIVSVGFRQDDDRHLDLIETMPVEDQSDLFRLFTLDFLLYSLSTDRLQYLTAWKLLESFSYNASGTKNRVSGFLFLNEVTDTGNNTVDDSDE